MYESKHSHTDTVMTETMKSSVSRQGGALHTMAEPIVDPVWTVYFDGRPMEINRPACGYSVKEWREGGREFLRAVLVPESLELAREATRSVRATGCPLHNIEISIRGKDGGRRYRFLVNYSPVFNARGEVVGIQGDGRDVTELRDLESSFGPNGSLLVSLIESAGDVFWVYYFDARPGYANRGRCGYTRQEWMQGGIDFLRACVTHDDRRKLDNALEYLRASGERVTNLPIEFTQKNSRTHLRFKLNLAPVHNAAGAVIGVHGLMHDISELTAARAALERSEARFRDLIESAHDLVWRTDRAGRWIYLNPASQQVYGCSPTELLGKELLERSHPQHREKDALALAQVLRGKPIVQHETLHLRADGSPRHLSFNATPQLDENWEVIGAMGIARDVTEQKLYEQELKHLADHDILTNLYNRHFFERALSIAVATAQRGQSFGLMYIDLDNFKYVNDTLGHGAGDQLLVQMAELLRGRMRPGDVLARFGGDEFTVLLQDMSEERLAQVVHSFHALFSGHTYFSEGRMFDVRVSIGATLIGAETQNPGDALAHADLACGIAKSRGRNQAHIYNPADRTVASMVEDVNWSRRLNEALAENSFTLLYQPLMRLTDNSIEHYETLLRLRAEDGTLIAPGAFLAAAERFGLLHAIDRWVVRYAIERLAREHAAGRARRFAVNLSGRAFADAELLTTIRRHLAETGVDPAALTFEVTESSAISQLGDAQGFIGELRALGCRFALDDFGSGFSSYSYLKFLPVDYLKIDGSFVKNLVGNPVDQAIVQSMNQVAHALGKETIAEFVENEEILNLLRAYGIDYAQGYHLGRPMHEPAPGC